MLCKAAEVDSVTEAVEADGQDIRMELQRYQSTSCYRKPSLFPRLFARELRYERANLHLIYTRARAVIDTSKRKNLDPARAPGIARMPSILRGRKGCGYCARETDQGSFISEAWRRKARLGCI